MVSAEVVGPDTVFLPVAYTLLEEVPSISCDTKSHLRSPSHGNVNTQNCLTGQLTPMLCLNYHLG